MTGSLSGVGLAILVTRDVGFLGVDQGVRIFLQELAADSQTKLAFDGALGWRWSPRSDAVAQVSRGVMSR